MKRARKAILILVVSAMVVIPNVAPDLLPHSGFSSALEEEFYLSQHTAVPASAAIEELASPGEHQQLREKHRPFTIALQRRAGSPLWPARIGGRLPGIENPVRRFLFMKRHLTSRGESDPKPPSGYFGIV